MTADSIIELIPPGSRAEGITMTRDRVAGKKPMQWIARDAKGLRVVVTWLPYAKKARGRIVTRPYTAAHHGA